MTNRLAIILLVLICLGFALDLAAGWGGTLYLLRRLADLIEWMAFWR